MQYLMFHYQNQALQLDLQRGYYRSYRQPTVPSNATVYVFYDAIPLATFLHIPLAGAKSTLNVLELLNTHKDPKWRIVMDFAAAKYYVFQ